MSDAGFLFSKNKNTERERKRENNLEMEKRRGKNISEYTKILSNSTVMNTLVKQYKNMIPPPSTVSKNTSRTRTNAR